MDTPRRLIVGYDLCEDFTQISCYSYKSLEPVPISAREEDELNLIPTALYLKSDSEQWLFGDEAVACAADGSGVLIDHLLNKLVSGEEITLFEQKFSGAALLEQYFRKTLTLVKRYFPVEPITRIVVTVRNTQPALVEGIYAALASLGLEKDRASVFSHAGAYLYYALSQDKSLWMNDVGLFDFSEEGLLYYQIRLNRRSKPMIAGLSREEYTQLLNYGMLKKRQDNLVYIFENITNTALYKQLVTTLYFTGKGFDGGWADEVIKGLCKGRRAFRGQNLFSKGACYAAKEFSGDAKLKDFILLDDDMMASFVGVRVYCDAKFQDIPMAEVGESWYEVNKSIEVIPEGEPELEIILKNIMTAEAVRERIHLTKLPDRPDRMTRLEINFSCKDKSTGLVTINDLGFGEIYPATGCIMEFSVEI